MQKENKLITDIIGRLTQARNGIDECLSQLSATSKISKEKSRIPVARVAVTPRLNYALNERAFVKVNVNGLSGPKKFVLLMAHETKGKTGVEVPLQSIRSKWNRMTSKNLLEYDFNLKYPNEAKTNGWVNSKKSGVYHLLSGWTGIFN